MYCKTQYTEKKKRQKKADYIHGMTNHPKSEERENEVELQSSLPTSSHDPEQFTSMASREPPESQKSKSKISTE